MLPLSAWPLSDRQRVVGVLTDIDDTLTTGAAITPDALDALQSLRAAVSSIHTNGWFGEHNKLSGAGFAEVAAALLAARSAT